MEKFDEIPIKDLNKVEAYQPNNIIEEQEEDMNEESLTIQQQIQNPKWKIRMKAYKTISELFYNEYSKECQNKKNNLQNKDNEEELLLDQEQEQSEDLKVFETYGPLMEKIITDSNLVAQYEALNCLFAYMRFSPDIKIVTFQVHSILLEKVQFNKPNFKDITMKILICMLRRDKTSSIAPELLKRFRNKNVKVAQFAMEVILETFKNQQFNDESNLKTIFKVTTENLSHSNKELRDLATDLLKEVFKLCEDDEITIVQNIKNLRPVQQKDIKVMLSEVQKSTKKKLVSLFSSQNFNENMPDLQMKGKMKNKDQECSQAQDEVMLESQERDLFQILPENFNEIPYQTSINQKKKAMELFNNELESIVKKNQRVLAKDYTQILNVIVHMMEDSNVLVFMEAIKSVEYIIITIGKNLRSQKIKQFVGLLCDKYKETKVAVIQTVNKVILKVFQSQIISSHQLVEHMINNLSFSHKNPRVKQLILEKVDQILKENLLKKNELKSLFKSIKDKCLSFVQKDSNASVRDATVQLFITFKMLLPDIDIVNETVNSLPKYRINEIKKKAEELKEQVNITPKNQTEQDSSQDKVMEPKSSQEQTSQNKEFLYQANGIDEQYQVYLSEIVTSIKKFRKEIPNIKTLRQLWNQNIEGLGEEGVKEVKHIIISCVLWLLEKEISKLSQIPELLLEFLKLQMKLYSIERSVKQTDQEKSVELQQSITICCLIYREAICKVQCEAVLNILFTSCHAQLYLETLKQVVYNFRSNSEKSVHVIKFVFEWTSNKLDEFLSKGLIFSDFNDLIQIAFKYVSDDCNIQEKGLIQQVITNFQNSIENKQKQMEYFEQSSIDHQEDQDDCEKAEVSNLINSLPQSPNKQEEQLKMSALQNPQKKSKGQEIVETFNESFEKGLILVKELAKVQEEHDQETKSLVFSKLLQIIENHCKNPQQQYQQAYALKAILWFKEEILGLEDCFNFTTQIMNSYANAEINGKDNSVEKYLLDNWIKELSLRDLIDRISLACQRYDSEQFIPLFSWLITQYMKNKTEEKWMIDDFRKVSLYLAKNIRHEQIQQFLKDCINKFGQTKVTEFMEIQLMNSPKEYNQFIQWIISITDNSQDDQQKVQCQSKLRIPQINVENLSKTEQNEQNQEVQRTNTTDQQCRSQLKNTEESICLSSRAKSSGQHSQLYQQMREKRKTNQKRNEDSDIANKYEDIISRLESQLHSYQPQKLQNQPMEETQVIQSNDTESKNLYQNISNRYDIVKTEEEQREKYREETQVERIEEAQNKLMSSQIKEVQWKDEVKKLEQERNRIERERDELMQEKDKESEEWKDKYELMKQDHQDVIENLKEANKCYLMQVSENEDLRQQLQAMSQQHQQMMKKFEEIEQKLNKREEEKFQREQEEEKKFEQNKQQQQNQVIKQSCQIIQQEKLIEIENIFQNENGQIMKYESDGEIGIKKIQELLLHHTQQVDEQIGQPLFFYYTKISQFNERLNMIRALNQAIENEDVLFAISNEVYSVLLHFLLKVFSQEKGKLESQSLRVSQQSASKEIEQNEITVEVQKLVSKLLNSKEFTTSLVTLLQILRQSMPHNFEIKLSEEQRQILKVILRCISRITRALHSEHPDLIRAFDVLLEMQKMFDKHPPEQLREDLPSLADLDLVYRNLKEVSDKLMDIQPEKVLSFLNFVSNKRQNTFNKYMQQMMQMRGFSKQMYQEYNDSSSPLENKDEIDDYEYNENYDY